MPGPVPALSDAVLLGGIQGLTEFLPVSSSGHLVLAQHFLGWADPGDNLTFDVILHAGTLLAVLWFFRGDILPFLTPAGWKDPQRRHLASLIIAASIPTAAIGLTLEKPLERAFASPGLVCLTLLATAIVLWVAGGRSASAGRSLDSLTLREAIVLGIVQGIAVTPGISRSGSTIATAILLGIGGTEAGRFSFLLSVPAVGGVVVLHLRKVLAAGALTLPPAVLTTGFLVSAVIGLLSLSLLMLVLKRQSLRWFSAYLLVLVIVAAAALYGAPVTTVAPLP